MKKVLIVSQWAPPLRRGAPIMLGNLLHYFPRDSYEFLTNGAGFEEEAIRKNYSPDKYHFYVNDPKTFLPKTAKPYVYYFSPIKTLRNLVNVNFGPLVDLYKIIKLGLKIIRERKIEVLLGTSINGPLIATWLLHVFTKKPYVIFLFDLYCGNLIEGVDKIFARLFEGQILKNASKVIVTNEVTKSYYDKKYKIDSLVIYNSITPPKEIVKGSIKAKMPQKPYSVVYAGAVYWAQEEGLKGLVLVMDKLKDYKLRILSSHTKIVESTNVSIGEVSPELVQKEIEKSDIAFLTLSFHTKAPDIIKTATPGKFSEYLLSKVPILIFAPKNSAVSKYAQKTKTALVIDEYNLDKLSQGIKNLIKNQKLRNDLVNNAYRLFWQNHNAVKSSEVLKNLINNL